MVDPGPHVPKGRHPSLTVEFKQTIYPQAALRFCQESAVVERLGSVDNGQWKYCSPFRVYRLGEYRFWASLGDQDEGKVQLIFTQERTRKIDKLQIKRT